MNEHRPENSPPREASDHIPSTNPTRTVQAYSEIGIWSWKELLFNRDHNWGGKAFNLAILANSGFPIPPAVILSRPPNVEDWQILLGWWEHMGHGPLAVRSSFAHEDGSKLSFAGQQKTFLNQVDELALLDAIHNCFKSVEATAAQAYREYFHQSGEAAAMNVLVQVMVDAQYAGVFFSTDPRTNNGQWIMEVTPGLGDSLVSAQITPTQIRADQACGLDGWREIWTDDLVLWGLEAQRLLACEVDMEWAVDSQGKIWILQVRPITALPQRKSNHNLATLSELPTISPETTSPIAPIPPTAQPRLTLTLAPTIPDASHALPLAALDSAVPTQAPAQECEEPTLIIPESTSLEPETAQADQASAIADDTPVMPESAEILTPLSYRHPGVSQAEATHPTNPLLLAELERIIRQNSNETLWDGQTFGEISGPVSPLAFSLWQEAFGPLGAFSKALKTLGYSGYTDHDIYGRVSVLESLLGHAYVNLTALTPLFFGPIPFAMELTPRPRLCFSWRQLNRASLRHTPQALSNMVRVGWRLQTNRQAWLAQAEHDLMTFQIAANLPTRVDYYESWATRDLHFRFLNEAHHWADESLQWVLTLVMMAEANLQSLQALLTRSFGAEDGKAKLQRWLGAGLHTATREMQEAFIRAQGRSQDREEFLATYGHRGPGDLDISRARWAEIHTTVFAKSPAHAAQPPRRCLDIEQEILSAPRFYRPSLRQEWSLLSQILELRERWKMALMRPYTHLRWMALELGRRWHIGDDVFYLTLDELVSDEPLSKRAHEKIAVRKQKQAAWRSINLPPLLRHQDLVELLLSLQNPSVEQATTSPAPCHYWHGEPLSPGVATGQVRVVVSPLEVDLETWPEDVILVAEATDPGWTPLFVKVRGVIVAKGGLLSHCAILAREMGLPAISQVANCHQILKDGDYVWMDANQGRIIRHLGTLT